MKKLKETLNLPSTGFSMKANLAQKEPEILKFWEEMDLYSKILEKNKNKPKFILHDGPPYANGPIHLGHVVNKVLKDIIIKSKIRLKTMRLVFLSFAFLFSVIYFSQQNPSYTILNNNCTARNSSLGGYPIGVIDSDPSLAIFLPSNLSKLNTDKLVINYNNHFADSDFGMINYNLSLKKKGNFSIHFDTIDPR